MLISNVYPTTSGFLFDNKTKEIATFLSSTINNTQTSWFEFKTCYIGVFCLHRILGISCYVETSSKWSIIGHIHLLPVFSCSVTLSLSVITAHITRVTHTHTHFNVGLTGIKENMSKFIVYLQFKVDFLHFWYHFNFVQKFYIIQNIFVHYFTVNSNLWNSQKNEYLPFHLHLINITPQQISQQNKTNGMECQLRSSSSAIKLKFQTVFGYRK